MYISISFHLIPLLNQLAFMGTGEVGRNLIRTIFAPLPELDTLTPIEMDFSFSFLLTYQQMNDLFELYFFHEIYNSCEKMMQSTFLKKKNICGLSWDKQVPPFPILSSTNIDHSTILVHQGQAIPIYIFPSNALVPCSSTGWLVTMGVIIHFIRKALDWIRT